MSLTQARTPGLIEKAMEAAQTGEFATDAKQSSGGGQTATTQAHQPKPFTLDAHNLTRQGLLAPTTIDTPLGRQIAAIKRNMLRRLDSFGGSDPNFSGGATQSVLVTSPEANDGKSFIALNLAIDIACEDGIDVVLIDADPRGSNLKEVLDLPESLGFVDLLHDPDLLPQACLLKERSHPLTILPAGHYTRKSRINPNVRRISEVIEQVFDCFPNSLIVVDAPPLLLTTEAPILAKTVQEIIMVVNAGHTDQNTVDSAIGMLDNTDKVALVLNRCRLKSKISSYLRYEYGDR